MKKNKFTCTTCNHDINTGDRDNGTQPMVVGCTQPDCDGVAKTHFGHVDQNIEPEMIFIKPKNHFEWKAIENELEIDIRTKHPAKKDRKVKKMHDQFMLRIRDHVRRGGLVLLPINIVENLPKTFSVQKN